MMNLDLGHKIPCSCAGIPSSAEIFPCSVEQGILLQAFEFTRVPAVKIAPAGWIRGNSRYYGANATSHFLGRGQKINTMKITMRTKAIGPLIN
jgi:hypothetical protein